MPVHPLVAALANAEGLPRKEIAACRTHRDEMVPVFLDILRRAAGTESLPAEEDKALFFIIHLLSEFAETAAFAPLTAFLRADAERVEEVLGDAITGTLGRVLATIFDGNAASLEGVIEDASVNEFARNAAMQAWTTLVVTGRIDCDHARKYLGDLAGRLQPRDSNFVWVGWSDAVAYLGFADLTDAVRAAFDDGRIDRSVMGFKHFEKTLAAAQATDNLLALMEEDEYGHFTDCIEEFSHWHGFSDAYRREQQRKGIAAGRADTVVNPHRHVGRNDSCPCGSGKKFKKCCGG